MADTPPLTRRQRDVLDFLRRQALASHQPPSLDAICAALGVASRGSLYKHVKALVAAGLVEPLNGRRSGVRLTHAVGEYTDTLPLFGRIAAGRPIEAVTDEQRLRVPEQLRSRHPCYVLQVRGDSMVEDGILDGDWVVVEQREQARNGEVVVALVDGSEATLKRIEQRPGEVVLHPANRAMAPIRLEPERLRIQGVVVGLMRSYG